jgi:VWFA-related protein
MLFDCRFRPLTRGAVGKWGCGMRRILITALLPIMAIPSWAAKRMTVAQLEQMLGTEKAAHKSDIEIARKISDVELSERLTDLALGELSKQFAGGSQPAMALLLLADRSSFLDTPAKELPATPAPDAATQQQLQQAAKRFAVKTLPNLPNLLATRTTFSFDDSPQEVTKGGYPQRVGLHSVGSSKAEVSVWDEKERPLARTGYASSPAQGGLTTWGEFGSLLLITLSDSSEGRMVWSHWENTAAGVVAVFQYEVPKAASHYEINTPVEQIQHSTASTRWASDGGTSARVTMATIHSKPGYKGTLWVDPATGTIVRVTLVADLKGDSAFERIAILVDYGAVQIANKTLICPLRSLALASAPATVNASLKGAATEWLNENLFNGYHMFASTSRILTEQSAAAVPPAPSSTENAPNVQAAGEKSPLETASTRSLPQQAATPILTAPAPATVTTRRPEQISETPGAQEIQAQGPVEGQPLPPAGKSTSLPAANMQAPQAGASLPESGRSGKPPVQAEPVTEQATTTVAVNKSPDFSVAPPGSVSAGGVTLHVEVPELLIPAVVRDKQGRAVGKLSQSDFTVFDQGKIRAITGFTVVKSAGAETGATVGPGVAGSGTSFTPAAAQHRFILFLFDDRHLNSTDLAITQTAAIKMLDEPLAATDYAAVVSFSGVNSGITRDRAVLQAAIRKLKVHRTFQHDSHDCPDVDYYSADKILNKHDAMEFAVAVTKASACGASGGFYSPENPGNIDDPKSVAEKMARSAAMQALAIGEEDAHTSLLLIGAVVSAMSKLPGQRTLILVSPGFLSPSPDAMAFKSQVLDQAAGSNVVINALDARGLYSGNADASLGPKSTISDTFGQTSGDRLAAMESSENVMAELAYGTGGTFFHNNNDLASGLKSLAAAPEYLYLLQVSLKDVKSTGTYHRLQVKVDQHDLDVRARRGYFAPKATNGRQPRAPAEDQKN